jgi:uncharacterized protein YprB with RNaseH-like and TPR domain
MKEKHGLNFGLERSPEAKVTIKNGEVLKDNDVTIRETINAQDTGTQVLIKYINDSSAKITVSSSNPKEFSFDVPFISWFNEEGEFVIEATGKIEEQFDRN